MVVVVVAVVVCGGGGKYLSHDGPQLRLRMTALGREQGPKERPDRTAPSTYEGC